MSTITKLTILIIVIMLITAGAWWKFSSQNGTQNQTANTTIKNPPKTIQTPDNNGLIELSTSPEDNSNAALESDLSVLNTQIDSLNKDSADIDQSFDIEAQINLHYAVESAATIIIKADDEIDQKVQTLNDLIVRINSMQKISSGDKNTLIATVQGLVDNLEAFKTKIDSDNTAQAANDDYKSMANAYRVYALIIPQMKIIAASDKIMLVVNSVMDIIGNKIQTRLAAISGVSATALSQIFSDFTAKVTDASVQADDAKTLASGIDLGGGDTVIFDSNKTTLKNAQDKIKKAIKDLEDARKDLVTLVKTFKEMGTDANK